ncbi:thiamine diphosphokinase [Paracoccus homiensis]|uniref:thiamine diphosphokinase n=1 Tax=Paracoccus homiensis TaxID=364199 RepID=UPI00398D028D
MTGPVVQSRHGVTVIGGGLVTPEDLALALRVAPTLVAADGGADRAFALGMPPDWVIGDLDSISDSARGRMRPDRVLHISEQDSTDFSKCLTRIDAPFVVAVGFAGLRLDHTLAALTTLIRAEHPRVILLASDDIAFPVPRRLTLPLMPGTRVSLYPMGPARGTSSGLEWPIDGIEFSPAGRVGTSNRANGLVSLQIEGPMLILLPRDCLSTALNALGLGAA